MKIIINILLALVLAGPAFTSSVPFNITLDGPFPDDFDTNQVYYIAHTTQFSNNVLKIESSVDSLFAFSASATWACYPVEQGVAGIFYYPRGDEDRFYRAVNTPCGAFSPAGHSPETQIVPTLDKKQQRWHTKEGYKLGIEIVPSPDKVRRFILVKPPRPVQMPPGLPGVTHQASRRLRSPHDSPPATPMAATTATIKCPGCGHPIIVKLSNP